MSFSLSLCLCLALGPVDLGSLDRTIVKEPKYEGTPSYCLLALGPQAKHKVWLVLDGKTLYVDRNGNGDLTEPEEKLTGKEKFGELVFTLDEMHFSGQRYTKLHVGIRNARPIGEAWMAMPMFAEFLARHPEGKLYSIHLETPLHTPMKGADRVTLREREISGTSGYDARGILQFAAKPADAPVLHFGGAWTVAPDGQQRLVRGRAEDLTVLIGTPGHGPGTFVRTVYDRLVPDHVKPEAEIEFPARADGRKLVQRFVLEDRC